MDIHVLRAFGQELEKLSISAGTTLNLLKARAGQGARIAPAMMQRAEHAAASGMRTTSPAMRHMAIEAGGAAKAQQRVQALAPVKAGLQGRIQAADAMPGRFSTTPLKHHDGLGNTMGYSKGHIDAVAGSSSRIADPKGLLTAPQPVALDKTVNAKAQQNTVAVKRPRALVPPVAVP